MLATREMEFMTHTFYMNILRNGTMLRLLRLIEDIEEQPTIIRLESMQSYIKILSYSHQVPQKEIWNQVVEKGQQAFIEPAYATLFSAIIETFELLSEIDAKQAEELDLAEWRSSLQTKFDTLEAALVLLDN